MLRNLRGFSKNANSGGKSEQEKGINPPKTK